MPKRAAYGTHGEGNTHVIDDAVRAWLALVGVTHGVQQCKKM
jgi:hypothetical protein